MKKQITLLALSCFMVACSGSSGSGGGGTPVNPKATAFEKATAGTWYSECYSHPQVGQTIEELKIGGGKGTITYLAFQTQDCSGQSREAGKVEFTYTVTSNNGDTTELTMKIKDVPADQKATVRVNGDVMSVTGDQGTRNYQRPANQGGGNPQNPGAPQNPGTDMAAFDAAAKGTWATDNCYELNPTGTVVLVLEVSGNGKATQTFNKYTSPDCSGQPTAQNIPLTYTVDQFANGQGQLTLNGQGKVSVGFQGGKMIIQDQGGTFQYSKIR